jgi:hypothetical protein
MGTKEFHNGKSYGICQGPLQETAEKDCCFLEAA